jgi:hypothetical protein
MAERSNPRCGDAWRSPAATFDGPASYTIRVEGHLSPEWSARLGGLCVTLLPGAVPVTDLAGELCDQAALLGVLNTLYDLGLPLLAVARLPGTSRHPGAPREAGGAPGPHTP